MSYSIKKSLDKPANDVINKLKSYFDVNDWEFNYINKHKFRCYDDVTNISNLSPKHVLNIGGGPYVFEAFAISKGIKVSSVDLDPSRHMTVIEKLGIDVLKVDIEDSEARSNLQIADFDVIAMCEILEHMRIDLIGMLRFLKNNMNRNACLYITTPNFYFLRNLLGILKNKLSGPGLVSEWSKLEHIGHMGHVREYSKIELVELFPYVGFEVASCKLRNRDSVIRRSLKNFVPSIVFTVIERSIDLFAQEFVFKLRLKNDEA